LSDRHLAKTCGHENHDSQTDLGWLEHLENLFFINSFKEFLSLMTLTFLINRRNPLLLKNNKAT
jgi:hypothetical protein